MQNDANSAKTMHHTRYFKRSICSKGLGCGEVKNFDPGEKPQEPKLPGEWATALQQHPREAQGDHKGPYR